MFVCVCVFVCVCLCVCVCVFVCVRACVRLVHILNVHPKKIRNIMPVVSHTDLY